MSKVDVVGYECEKQKHLLSPWPKKKCGVNSGFNSGCPNCLSPDSCPKHAPYLNGAKDHSHNPLVTTKSVAGRLVAVCPCRRVEKAAYICCNDSFKECCEHCGFPTNQEHHKRTPCKSDVCKLAKLYEDAQ